MKEKENVKTEEENKKKLCCEIRTGKLGKVNERKRRKLQK